MSTVASQLTTSMVVAAAALALGACSFDGRIADHAVSYNRTAEEASNKNLLTNVLRAKDRRPMHFTRFAALRGGFTVTGDAGLSGSFPVGLNSTSFTLSPSIGGSGQTRPGFEVGVLDDQEFMNGLLDPIELLLFDYYLTQGWPKDLLQLLLIEKIEIVDEDGGRRILDNDPEDSVELEEFRDAIGLWRDNFRVASVTRKAKPFGPEMLIDDQKPFEIANIPHIAKAKERGLTIEKICRDEKNAVVKCELQHAKEFLQLQVPGKAELRFCVVQKCENRLEDEEEHKKISDSGGAVILGFAEMADSSRKAQKFLLDRGMPIEKIKSAAIHLRSVQGIIYYLGEVVRTYENSEGKAEVATSISREAGCPNNEMPLFRLAKAGGTTSAAQMAVDYRGETYEIPAENCAAGRTTQVMSLITQLLALKKKGEALPSPRSIPVIAQ